MRAVITESLVQLAAPIDTLTLDPENANRGDVAAIRKSLNVFGQRKPVVVRRTGHDADGRPTGIVVAGNHTLMAATELGWDHIAAVFIDDDVSTAKAYALADNRTGELSTWDTDQLAETLRDLTAEDFDVTSLGWSEDELAALLLGDIPVPDEPEDEDEGDDPDTTPPREPITKPGDVWQIGQHRIICGDCRDFATVERLLDGARINVAFTSPPYASQRTYDESSGFKPIPQADYVDWFRDVQANVRAVLADDGSWFVNIKEHCDDGQRSLYVKDLTIAHVREWAWRFVDELCWTRNGLPGRWPDRFKNRWEPVFHFAGSASIRFRPEGVAQPSDKAVSYDPSRGFSMSTGGYSAPVLHHNSPGMALPSNVIDIASGGVAGSAAAGHPAQFPVGLPAFFVKAYSDPGDAVYDPFLGSGSTLVAAEQNGRAGYGCEISAGYVDVALRRLQKASGVLPVLVATGQAYDFLVQDEAEAVS